MVLPTLFINDYTETRICISTNLTTVFIQWFDVLYQRFLIQSTKDFLVLDIQPMISIHWYNDLYSWSTNDYNSILYTLILFNISTICHPLLPMICLFYSTNDFYTFQTNVFFAFLTTIKPQLLYNNNNNNDFM